MLFPGDDDPSNRAQYYEYQELLPGLGAFVLRPSQNGEPSGIRTLRVFLDQVLDHVATRLTHHERGRYWLEEVYGSYDPETLGASSLAVGRPGPDTTVLLGYVKSAAHWTWIQRTKTYNVRTEERPGGVTANAELLYAQLLLLYCPAQNTVALARIVSGPERVGKAAMESTGYPHPSSNYLCVQLSWVASQEWVAAFGADHIDRFVQQTGRLRGEPVAVSWADLDKMSSN